MSIVTILLRANENENLTTRFSANKTDFEGRFIFIHVTMATVHTSVCVVNLRVAIFGATKGSRVLEKKEIKTQVPKLCSATFSDS